MVESINKPLPLFLLASLVGWCAATPVKGQSISALIDISHEFLFYFDGRWGRAYLEPAGDRYAMNWATLSTYDLTNANLLVLQQGGTPCEYTEADCEHITDFVHAGGGLLLLGEYAAPPEGGEYRLNTVARWLGIEFLPQHPQRLSIAEHPITVKVREDFLRLREVPLERFSLLHTLQPEAWEALAYDEASGALCAVRHFGAGRIAAIGSRSIFSDRPEEGYAPFYQLTRGIVEWLTVGKVIDPAVSPETKMPELERQHGAILLQYSSYLEPHAQAIGDLYWQVHREIEDFLGVPLSPGRNQRLILLPTGGGGFSSGIAIGIGTWWGGFPRERYPMIELLGHEATHSWVLPYGEPMWNEGLATYVGIEVGRRLGFAEEADRTRQQWAQWAEQLDPNYDQIDLTQPERPELHNVYMGKPMWIFDQLRQRYGDDLLARYFRTKRELMKETPGAEYSPDDAVYILSQAAGEDLFGWFNSLAISVSSKRVQVP